MIPASATALVAAAALMALLAPAVGAQGDGPSPGDVAPDFTLRGSTRDGLLAKPVHLAEFRGQTVVLAFFPKSRTKG